MLISISISISINIIFPSNVFDQKIFNKLSKIKWKWSGSGISQGNQVNTVLPLLVTYGAWTLNNCNAIPIPGSPVDRRPFPMQIAQNLNQWRNWRTGPCRGFLIFFVPALCHIWFLVAGWSEWMAGVAG